MSSANLVENEFVNYIAKGLAEYLKLNAGKVKIEGDKIYKFSMKLWFNIKEDNVNQISIAAVNFGSLNKSLNKKYRKAVNE